MAALRAIPNTHVWRPCDANETAAAWIHSIEHRTGPSLLALTRQNLPTLQASAAYYQVCKGAYIVSSEQGAQPQAILMASGSEVHIALEAQQVLRARGVDARVLSMPCIELFRKQPVEYIEKLLPKHVTKRVAIEAASPFGWHEWVGEHGTVVGMKRFGASAPFEVLYEEFGITAEAVVKLLA